MPGIQNFQKESEVSDEESDIGAKAQKVPSSSAPDTDKPAYPLLCPLSRLIRRLPSEKPSLLGWRTDYRKMSFSLTTLPPHLVVTILKKVDISTAVHLAATCSRVNDLLAISRKGQLDRIARLVHLQRKYIKYAGRVAYWSSANRVSEALQGKIQIEQVFQKQMARAGRFHDIVTEMKDILQGIQPGDKEIVKEKLLLFMERHQPTTKMGEVSRRRIKDA